MENKDSLLPLFHFITFRTLQQSVRLSKYFVKFYYFAEICIHIGNKKVLANKKLLFICICLIFFIHLFKTIE